MKKIFLIICALLTVWIWVIIFDGIFDDKITGDKVYWIIYGNKVELTWEPSNRLKARLDTWLKLYSEENIQKIIVSGGIWVEWFHEAEVMKEYLISYWVESSNIIVDSDWYTTGKTSVNSFKIISGLESDMNNVSVIGISQYFHISRVKLSLRENGFKKVYWIAPKYFEPRDIYSIIRELPAYIKYKFI